MDHKLNKTKSLSEFFDEQSGEDESPSFHHFSLQRPGSPTYFNLDAASPLQPQSPESLWSPSPSLTPSHPSLLYCCLSSLHHDGNIYSIAVLGDLVLTGSSSRRVHAWQPLSFNAIGYIHASSGEVRAMVANGHTLFTSHKDHKIRVWDIGNFNIFKPRKVTTLPYNPSHFKNFISRSITAHHKHTSKSITLQHKDIISCMAYYHVEGLLYTGSFDRTIKAWKVSEKRCVDSFIAHEGSINDLVIDQQRGELFTCSSDGVVKMWLRVQGEASASHALIKVLTFHTYPIYALALALGMSPSQRSFLYSGSFNGVIKFWQRELPCQYTHGGFLEGHQFAVLCIVALEDLVISGSEDSTIRIWKKEIGRGINHECLAVLKGHRGPVRCLAAAFLQKDDFAMSFLVYSASMDHKFKVWRVKLLPDLKNSSSSHRRHEDYHMEDRNTVKFETTPSCVVSLHSPEPSTSYPSQVSLKMSS